MQRRKVRYCMVAFVFVALFWLVGVIAPCWYGATCHHAVQRRIQSRDPLKETTVMLELTYLTKQEILLAHKRFSEIIQKEYRSNIEAARVPKERFLTLPELKANPFKHRICHVFSTSEQADDSMSFEDFLDMLSAFSDSATLEVKSHYAFRIFDFDGDGALNERDLETLVNHLTGEEADSKLSNNEMRQLIANILDESDIDKDGTINHSEFQHVISRSPDFVSSFKIIL